MRLGTSSKLKLACLSFSGIVAGHLAAYAFVAPDPHERTGLLASTGHGSWTLPIYLAMALVVPAFCTAISDRLRGQERSYSRVALGLGALQVGGFVTLEALERLGAGGLSAELLNEPAVVVGVIVNIIIALIAPVFLTAVAAAFVKLVTARPRSVQKAGLSIRPRPQSPFATGILSWAPAAPRGPPAVLSIS
jgi:hypothetical protein